MVAEKYFTETTLDVVYTKGWVATSLLGNPAYMAVFEGEYLEEKFTYETRVSEYYHQHLTYGEHYYINVNLNNIYIK